MIGNDDFYHIKSELNSLRLQIRFNVRFSLFNMILFVLQYQSKLRVKLWLRTPMWDAQINLKELVIIILSLITWISNYDVIFINCKIRINLSVKLPLFFLCQGFILKVHFTSGENLITADRRLDFLSWSRPPHVLQDDRRRKRRRSVRVLTR